MSCKAYYLHYKCLFWFKAKIKLTHVQHTEECFQCGWKTSVDLKAQFTQTCKSCDYTHPHPCCSPTNKIFEEFHQFTCNESGWGLGIQICFKIDTHQSCFSKACLKKLLKCPNWTNPGTKWTFGLITHRYLVDRSLRFDFMIIEFKEFYL